MLIRPRHDRIPPTSTAAQRLQRVNIIREVHPNRLPRFDVRTEVRAEFLSCTIDAPMRKNEPVSKIMSSTLQTVHDGERISKLRTIFEQANIHHLPVVSGQKLVGIVSWNDYMRISFGQAGQGGENAKNFDEVLDHTYSLPDVMTTEPVTIPASGTIRDAARILGQGDFHSLPVVDGENLVGIVTSSDLIRFLAEQ